MRSKETELNNAAFRRLEESIKATYPSGQFVAFVGGEIVADGADFDELDAKLVAAGKDPQKAFVIQAGHYYPEYAIIF
jgi:hypothetical protein